MTKVKDGFWKQLGSKVGSDDYLLKAAGGYIGVGNSAGEVVPLNNSTLNSGLNADMVDGEDASAFLHRYSQTNTGNDIGWGTYTFRKDISAAKNFGSTDNTPVDIQHNTQFKVMRSTDTWSLTMGVREGYGWLDCVASGIGYGDIYLNPAGEHVIIGNYNGAYNAFSRNNKNQKFIVFGDQYISGAATFDNEVFSKHISIGYPTSTYSWSRAEVDIITESDDATDLWMGVNKIRCWNFSVRSSSINYPLYLFNKDVSAKFIFEQDGTLIATTFSGNATSASKVNHSISFKNISNNTVSFDGSNTLDLTSGIYYSTTSNTANKAKFLLHKENPRVENVDITPQSIGIDGMEFALVSSSASLGTMPPYVTSKDGPLLTLTWDSDSWGNQLHFGMRYLDDMHWRAYENGTYREWKTIIDSRNILDYYWANLHVSNQLSTNTIPTFGKTIIGINNAYTTSNILLSVHGDLGVEMTRTNILNYQHILQFEIGRTSSSHSLGIGVFNPTTINNHAYGPIIVQGKSCNIGYDPIYLNPIDSTVTVGYLELSKALEHKFNVEGNSYFTDNIYIGANKSATAYKSLITLFHDCINSQTNNDSTPYNGEGSWGINFDRGWGNGTYNSTNSAGIYAYGTGSWGTGLVFRVHNGNSSNTSGHTRTALDLLGNGSLFAPYMVKTPYLNIGNNTLSNYDSNRAEVDIVSYANDAMDLWLGVNNTRTWNISARGSSSSYQLHLYSYIDNPLFYIYGKVQARDGFTGDLIGNASTATKLSNTPNNTSTFLRGDNTWTNILYNTLNIFPSGGNYADGIRIHSRDTNNGWCAITFCASDNTGTTGQTSNSWYLGVQNGNLYIGKGATGSGDEHHLRSVSEWWECSGSWTQLGDLLLNNNFTNEHGIFFRNGFVTTNKYNVSILAYDHNGNGESPDGISINGYDGVSFCTGSNSRNEVMRITGGGDPGKVGIGTTSPSYKLHVVGNIYSSGFRHSGVNDDAYVLKAGGGYKAESSLSVNYASSAAGATAWLRTWQRGHDCLSDTISYHNETHVYMYDADSTNSPSGGAGYIISHTWDWGNGTSLLAQTFDPSDGDKGRLYTNTKPCGSDTWVGWKKIAYVSDIPSLSNYYTKTESDNRFVNVTGDTMTGALNISSTSSNRANINMISVANVPNDFYLGSNSSSHWSITSRNSSESYLLAFYSTGTGSYTATVNYSTGKWNFATTPSVNGTNVSLEGHTHSGYASSSHNHDDRYLYKNSSSSPDGDVGYGQYTFRTNIDETKYYGSVNGCPIDLQHRTQFRVMKSNNTWALTFGVKDNLGWIDCVANGIGYGDIYLNPAGVSVIIGNYGGSTSAFSKNNKSEKLILFGSQYTSGSHIIDNNLTASGEVKFPYHVAIGANLNTYSSSRAEFDVVSNSDNPMDIWLGSGAVRRWYLSCRNSSENYNFLIGRTNNDNGVMSVYAHIYGYGFHHSSVNSDSYVLLAGGGYKALSDIGGSTTVTNSAPALGKTAATIATIGGTAITASVGDSDKVDGLHFWTGSSLPSSPSSDTIYIIV